jgi:hypothetical protein
VEGISSRFADVSAVMDPDKVAIRKESGAAIARMTVAVLRVHCARRLCGLTAASSSLAIAKS